MFPLRMPKSVAKALTPYVVLRDATRHALLVPFATTHTPSHVGTH
jgi:hypothetical protein